MQYYFTYKVSAATNDNRASATETVNDEAPLVFLGAPVVAGASVVPSLLFQVRSQHKALGFTAAALFPSWMTMDLASDSLAMVNTP